MKAEFKHRKSSIMNPQFIINDKGEKEAVILSLQEYEEMLEQIEELEDIKLYDQTKESESEYIPSEQAFREIEKKHNQK